MLCILLPEVFERLFFHQNNESTKIPEELDGLFSNQRFVGDVGFETQVVVDDLEGWLLRLRCLERSLRGREEVQRGYEQSDSLHSRATLCELWKGV